MSNQKTGNTGKFYPFAHGVPNDLTTLYELPLYWGTLSGNDLRAGNSIIIYLLNNKMTKVQSIEKIFLLNKGRLRHFVTNSKNELYEDQNGDIYISVDSIGIHRLSFLGL